MMNDNILVQFKISNHKLLIEQGRYQIDHLSPATTPTTATTDITTSRYGECTPSKILKNGIAPQ